jgi:hypothetical protein
MDAAVLAQVTGMVGTICFFGAIIAVVLVPRWLKMREREAMQATLRSAIERGQPLPPEIVKAMTEDRGPAPSRGRDLRTGVIWLGIAAGLIGFAYALGYGEDTAEAFWPLIGIAAFPGFVGIAYLVNAALNLSKGKI